MFDLNALSAELRITAFLFYICGSPQLASANSPEKPTLTVETILAREGQSGQLSVYTGTIQPARQTALASELIGRIDSIHVDLGDRVPAGMVVCQLDRSRLEAERKRIAAELLSAQAKLREMISGSRTEQIAASRARLNEREAAVRLAKKNFHRREQLRTEGLIAGEVVDVARASLEQASAAVRAAREQLSEIEHGPREEQIAAQQAKTDAIEASLAVVEIDLEHTQIRCPYDASIVERQVDEGAVVAPGQPLLTIVEVDRHEAHLGVPHDIAKNLRIGQSVQLKVGSRKIEATLAAVLQRVDPQTRLRDCIIKIEGPGSSVVPGELAQASFRSATATEGLLIPQASLKRAPDGKWECFVVRTGNASETGTIVSRNVEVLSTNGATVTVRGELRNGEHVVASSIHRVMPGMQVRIRRGDQVPAQPDVRPRDDQTQSRTLPPDRGRDGARAPLHRRGT